MCKPYSMVYMDDIRLILFSFFTSLSIDVLKNYMNKFSVCSLFYFVLSVGILICQCVAVLWQFINYPYTSLRQCLFSRFFLSKTDMIPCEYFLKLFVVLSKDFIIEASFFIPFENCGKYKILKSKNIDVFSTRKFVKI